MNPQRFTRIILNNFGDTVSQILKSGKNSKKLPCSYIEAAKLADSLLSNGYHGNDDRYKNFDIGMGYLCPSSMTVHSFISIKWCNETESTSTKIGKIELNKKGDHSSDH